MSSSKECLTNSPAEPLSSPNTMPLSSKSVITARVITAAGVLDDGVIDQNADVVTDIQDFPISTLPEWDQPTFNAFVDVEDLIETVPAHFSLECQHFEQQFEPSSSSSTFEQFEHGSSSNLGSFTQVFFGPR